MVLGRRSVPPAWMDCGETRLTPLVSCEGYYRQVKIAGEDVVEEAPVDQVPDVIPGYDEEARITYTGGLSEDTGEESLAE